MEWVDAGSSTTFVLSRDELRRMNRLARAAPNLANYLEWYRELAPPDRMGLTCALLRYGAEYNTGERWDDAARAAGLNPDAEVLRRFAQCREPAPVVRFRFQETELLPWLDSLSERDREAAYRFAAAWFGLNERERYEACRSQGGTCEHWWHEDPPYPRAKWLVPAFLGAPLLVGGGCLAVWSLDRAPFPQQRALTILGVALGATGFLLLKLAASRYLFGAVGDDAFLAS